MINFTLSNLLVHAIIISITLPIFHILLLFLFKEKGENKIAQLLLGSIVLNIVLFFSSINYTSLDTVVYRNYGFYDGILYLGFIYIGYCQFYSLLRRGFTIRLLIDIYFSEKKITREELASSYSGGRGLEWLLKKRLSGLEKFRLVKINNTDIKLTNNFGIKLSKILLFISKIFGIKFAG